MMNNSHIHPPPPPPDCPPPSSQSRRSKKSSRTGTTKKAPQSAEPPEPEHDIQQSQQPPMTTPRHENSDSQTKSNGPIYTMEIDDKIPDTHISRFPRMPYFTKDARTDSIDGIFANHGMSFGESSVDFYGMRDVVSPNESTESVAGSRSSTLSRFQRLRKALRSFSFTKSPRSMNDDSSDDGSLSDFKDWTPPDSAYGAAFPICGWVPKHTRRAIEITIIGLFVFALVYFVVTTSIRISNDQSSSTSSNSESSNNKLADDDHYIDYDSEYKYMDDDKADDYFKEMDDAINAGDDGVNADDAVDDGAVDDDGNGRRFLRPF